MIMGKNEQRARRKSDNGDERPCGEARDIGTQNCSEPMMDCDADRQVWHSECHLLSLARSGCSVHHQLSLGWCCDSTPPLLGISGDLGLALGKGSPLPRV